MKDERIEKEKDILEKYNLKKINQDKTIGIIISKKENKVTIYKNCKGDRIYTWEEYLIN